MFLFKLHTFKIVVTCSKLQNIDPKTRAQTKGGGGLHPYHVFALIEVFRAADDIPVNNDCMNLAWLKSNKTAEDWHSKCLFILARFFSPITFKIVSGVLSDCSIWGLGTMWSDHLATMCLTARFCRWTVTERLVVTFKAGFAGEIWEHCTCHDDKYMYVTKCSSSNHYGK